MVIREKINKVKSTVTKENEIEISILAQKCLDKAREEGIKLPRRNLVISALEGDPYTWIIVKIGIVNRLIYQCRMTISDMAEAKMEAEKEEGT